MRDSAKNTENDAFYDSGNAECARLLKEEGSFLAFARS